jgi:16S rRNA (guanine527-N7)-methyltransferase
MSTFDHFIETAHVNQFELSENQIDLFRRLWNEFERGNKWVQLVSSNDLSRMPMRHFFDSIAPILFGLIPQEGKVLDIGSGGGLPGLPLAICYPKSTYTLVDSNRKKMTFVRHVVRTLSLNHVSVLTDRIENLLDNPEFENSFDVCVARAVTSIEKLVVWATPLLKENGLLVCFKGPAPESEIDQAGEVAAMNQCRIENVFYVKDLDEMSNMSLVVIKRVGC